MNKDEIKALRQDIGSYIQIEGNFGHVNTAGLKEAFNHEASSELMTRQEAFDLFNKVSEEQGLKPLRDPKGYMPVEDNVYDYLREAYEEKFSEQLERIHAGQSIGSPYAIQNTLDNLNERVARDTKRLVPQGMAHTELKHLAMSDELEKKINMFVNQRILYSASYSIRRQVSEESLQHQLEGITTKGLAVAEEIKNEMALVDEELTAEYADINGHALADGLDSLNTLGISAVSHNG